MLNNVLLQPAYILHTRLYRDTSLLIEIFTPDYGRVSLVARGVRGNRARYKGMLQPFMPLLISWRGRSELMSLTGVEANGAPQYFMGNTLLCGIYLNELLMRLLHRYDAHPKLYQNYQRTLNTLAIETQVALRIFEKTLLAELGYALQLSQEAQTGAPIKPAQFYYFEPTRGVFDCTNVTQQNNVFSGEVLLSIHHDEFTDPGTMKDAKRLLRIALNFLLGGKPVRSRELFL